jgi:hypothetical protein
MPVDRTLGSDLADTVTALYAEAELVLTKQIANRIGSDLGAPDWAEKRLAQVGEMRRIAERVTARLAADTTGKVAEAVAAAYRRGGENALSEMAKLGGARPGAASAIRGEATGSAAVQRLANALITRLGGTHLPIVRETVDAYRRVITSTVASGTLQGSETRRESAQRAMKKFAAHGITGFTDKANRQWQLTSYVEMATRTGTAQAAVEGHMDRLEDLGVDLVIVSNAPQECEKCRPWEGKILARRGPHGRRTIKVEHSINDGEMIDVEVAGTVDEAVRDGFMHPNCRHSLSAYLPGVTKPITNTEDPEGDKARQKQRAIERSIRQAKMDIQASISPLETKQAKVRLTEANTRLTDHLASNPALKRLKYREEIGAGNLPTKSTSDAGVQVNPQKAPAKPTPAAAAKPKAPEPAAAKPPAQPAPKPKAPAVGKPQTVTPKPAAPSATPAARTPTQLADALAAGKSKPADLTDDELHLADKAFTDRAAQLGKPDQVSSTHMAVRKELTKRTPKGVAPTEKPALTVKKPAAPAAKPTPQSATKPAAPEAALGMQAARRFTADTEAVLWAQKNMPLPPLTKAGRKAVVTYTGPDYIRINRSLRGLEEFTGKEKETVDGFIKDLDGAFAVAAAPEALIVHRATTRITGELLGADLDVPDTMNALVGKTFVEPGFVSTSLGAKAAYKNAVNFMFRVPAGYPAINAMPLARYSEQEIMVRRNAKYVIHAAYQHESTWFIEAEFVPDGWEPGADWKPTPYGDAWKGYLWTK